MFKKGQLVKVKGTGGFVYGNRIKSNVVRFCEG